VVAQLFSFHMKSQIFDEKDKIWRLMKTSKCMSFFTMLIADVSLASITTQSILFINTSSLTQKQEKSETKKNF
jgi:hypothetical protein